MPKKNEIDEENQNFPENHFELFDALIATDANVKKIV
jgi:hypothetical protein